MFIEQFFESAKNYRGKACLYGLAIVFLSWQFLGAVPISVEMARLKTLDVKRLMETIPSTVSFTLLLLPFAFGLLALWVVLKRTHRWAPLRSFICVGRRFDWSRFLFSFFLWGGVVCFSVGSDYWLHPENYEFIFNGEAFAVQLCLSFILIPLQAGFEEFFFRGYVMRVLGRSAVSRLSPLLWSSMVFGVMHGANPEVSEAGFAVLIFYICTGLLFGVMTLMDNGLELALGFHIANNLVSSVLVTSDWSVIKTEAVLKALSAPDLGKEIWLPIFALYPLVILLFAWKYGWTDWKGRLAGRILRPGD